MTMLAGAAPANRRGLGDKLARLNWSMITVLSAIACIGVIMHFSVADGSWSGMPLAHGTRFVVILVFTIMLALVDVRMWLAIAYPLYGAALVLLLGVEFFGATRMGAQRWLDIGPMSLQPSEIMKIAIVLALARYYQHLDPRYAGSILSLIVPVLMVVAPTALVMHQPDLGTSLMIVASGVGVMFLAGLRWRYIAFAAAVAVPAAVYAYFFLLHDYQRDRILTFLNPSADPLGTGYHVQQSKIAIGAAGVFGHGYLQGPQAQLDFLPEKHTDFIFTMIVEEFGLLGAFVVLFLFGVLMAQMLWVAMTARALFAKLAAAGVAITTATYVFINTAMVIGLVPVVGIPLPLLSFGGTAMLTLMVGVAIVLSAHLHRDTSISSRGLLW